MIRNRWVMLSTLALAAMATAACSNGREVVVTGSVSAPTAQALPRPINLTFYDVIDGNSRKVAESKLEDVGNFEQTLTLEGEAVRVLALVDANADGKCTDGELWTSIKAVLDDEDTVALVPIMLRAGVCPRL